MADLKWYIKRLRAMSAREILWRIGQRSLALSEERRFRDKRAVSSEIFNREKLRTDIPGLSSDKPLCDTKKLFLNFSNTKYGITDSIPLIAPYRYDDFKTRWHAGFQTDRDWPLVHSYRLDYRGMDAVGDARINWELNKHFQFAILAKDYFTTHNPAYLGELTSLFDDWNKNNPFLWGISWTSAIEVAERTINWCLTLAFLRETDDVPTGLERGLETGIINMADWLFHHYSRYSSANNHLVIEISAVLHAGVLAGNTRWINKAVEILDREIFLQNYSDGVNKEESLYYQIFVMEAFALDLRLLGKNGIASDRTDRWIPLLVRMTRYVRDCIGDYGEVVEFGDNDDGKLIDLSGGGNRYANILQFMACLLPERTLSFDPVSDNKNPHSLKFPPEENILWLFTDKELEESTLKPEYIPAGSVGYEEGGNAILRSHGGKILIGIDHAPLGFGELCAHGHADALSFQVFVKGKPFISDPGTYIYHTDIEARNRFRSTAAHNTVCIDGRDQSEMLGAFLWGKKANCRLINAALSDDMDIIEAEHDGYAPHTHRRRFTFDKKENVLTVEDFTDAVGNAVSSLLFATGISVTGADSDSWHCTGEDGKEIALIEFQRGFSSSELTEREISEKYGTMEKTVGLRAHITEEHAILLIKFEV